MMHAPCLSFPADLERVESQQYCVLMYQTLLKSPVVVEFSLLPQLWELCHGIVEVLLVNLAPQRGEGEVA